MTIPAIDALVPMKEHSVRVPRKNYRDFCGRPLFFWVLEQLQESTYIGVIIINTDCEFVLREAPRHFDVKLLERPDFLLGDSVPIQPLISYDIQRSTKDHFLQTHATNPLLTAETIDRSVEAFFSQSDHDSLMSVTPLRKRYYWPDGRPVNHDPDELLLTQDLPPLLEENSCIYIFSREVFARRNHRLGDRPLLFPMDPLEAVDIDDMADLEIAEALMLKRLNVAEARIRNADSAASSGPRGVDRP